MIKEYSFHTGEDGHSHVRRGSVVDNEVPAAESILFKETPPHSSARLALMRRQHNTSLRYRAYWNSRDPRRGNVHDPSLATSWWRRIPPAPGTHGGLLTTSPGKELYVAFKEEQCM